MEKQEDKIYYLKDQTKDNLLEWITGLNASGYAGCNPDGMIVDRREFPNAVPVQQSSVFPGIAKPKKL